MKIKRKHLYIGGAAFGVLLAVLIPILVVFVFTAPRFSFVGNLHATRAFPWDLDSTHALPSIQGNRDFNVRWEIVSQRYLNGESRVFAELIGNDADAHFTLLPLVDGDVALIHFRANISYRHASRDRVSHMDFNLRINDPREANFNRARLFSPNQSNRIAYRTQGLAEERVFGLWDITEIGRSFNFQAQSGQELYIKSGDTMNLATRYTGGMAGIDLGIFVVEGRQTITANSFDPEHDDYLGEELKPLVAGAEEGEYYFQNNYIRVDHVQGSTSVGVEFLNPGIWTVVARGERIANPDQVQIYSFTYEVIDAVNARDMMDIKALEYNARMDYIINGVKLRDSDGNLVRENGEYVYIINPLANPNDVWNFRRHTGTGANRVPVQLNAENPLNSQLFATGRNQRWHYAGQTNTTRPLPSDYMMDFHRWAPTFRYRDMVIRATTSRLDTWQEATWFFGDVHGNGFTLDATPYATNPAGIYRNTHTTGGGGEGLENRGFTIGSGWGDHFAFYALANHTTVHNIHLVGHNIVHPDGRPVRLNEYRNLSVIGSSVLGGADMDFQIGQRHNNGVFSPGWYNAGVTVSFAIVEKGLILVGGYFFPNKDYPFLLENSVMRYAGFTGMFARGIHGFDLHENGVAFGAGGDVFNAQGQPVLDSRGRQVVARDWAVNSRGQRVNPNNINQLWNVSGNNTTIPVYLRSEGGHAIRLNNDLGVTEITEDIVGFRNPHDNFRRFANFVNFRNIFAYEFTTVPVIVDNSIGETHFVMEGDYNYMYTWIRLTDLVFPAFKFPGMPPQSILLVDNITTIAQNLINATVLQEEYRPLAVFEGAHTWIHLPFISVVSEDTSRTHWEINGARFNDDMMTRIQMVIPLAGMGLNVSITDAREVEKLRDPDDQSAGTVGITMEQQREAFATGISGRITSWAESIRMLSQ